MWPMRRRCGTDTFTMSLHLGFQQLSWLGLAILLLLLASVSNTMAYQQLMPLSQMKTTRPFGGNIIIHHGHLWALSASENNDDSPSPTTTTTSLEEQGVIELSTTSKARSTSTTTSSGTKSLVPIFQSQGEIDPDTLNVDLSNPQQTRVILYIILSLLPVLFLVPFMLGSRDLIPLDALPPVVL
jgi:hypothetical protein